jgi:hypothetical protein
MEEVPSRHARFYGPHFPQDLCQPSCVVLLARVRTRRLRRSKGSGTPNNDD